MFKKLKHILVFVCIALFFVALHSCKTKEKVGREDVPYYLPEDFDEGLMEEPPH